MEVVRAAKVEAEGEVVESLREAAEAADKAAEAAPEMVAVVAEVADGAPPVVLLPSLLLAVQPAAAVRPPR